MNGDKTEHYDARGVRMILRREGGRRLYGQFVKKGTMSAPLVSIITVVRNDEKHIERAIQSVLNQSYENIEYIIIDGCSTDATIDKIRTYETKVAYWVSEPDKGIFDAMNKGASLATGDYALFLNADDYLYSDDVIEELISEGLRVAPPPLLIAGKVRFGLDEELLDWVWPADQEALLRFGPAHQATLISSTIYRQVKYQSFFMISGDTDFWKRLESHGLLRSVFVDRIVAVFRVGGRSNDPTSEHRRLVEHEISKYMLTGQFRVSGLVFRLILGSLRSLLVRGLGPRIYYKYLFIPLLRFRYRIPWLFDESSHEGIRTKTLP